MWLEGAGKGINTELVERTLRALRVHELGGLIGLLALPLRWQQTNLIWSSTPRQPQNI